jgi:5-methylcytosine-specific restriction protein A
MPTAPREPRRSAYARGYTKRWDRAAKAFRLRYPLCGMRPRQQPPVMSECHRDGRTTPATQTDHVQPHRGDQVLFWDDTNNWQSLCAACGAKKSQAGL